MDHHFVTLAWMEEKWPLYKKNEVFPAHRSNREGYAIAFEVGTLRILLGILRGKRGGASGEIVVVDTSQKIEVDKLLCVGCQSLHGFFMDRIRGHYADFDQYCPQLLVEMMKRLTDDSELIKTLATEIGFTESSVVTVSGGIPSLGKR
jgi:hypothetical protein